MGARTHCDGTGVEIPDGTAPIGHFGHVYSEEATPAVMEYLERLNALHTEMATQFQSDLAALRAEFRGRLAVLPDEP